MQYIVNIKMIFQMSPVSLYQVAAPLAGAHWWCFIEGVLWSYGWWLCIEPWCGARRGQQQ